MRRIIDALWPLKGTNPPLYTKKAADVIVNLETNKEYIRDEIVLFKVLKVEELPETIEQKEPEKWKFIYIRENTDSEMETNEFLREIYVGGILKC